MLNFASKKKSFETEVYLRKMILFTSTSPEGRKGWMAPSKQDAVFLGAPATLEGPGAEIRHPESAVGGVVCGRLLQKPEGRGRGGATKQVLHGFLEDRKL